MRLTIQEQQLLREAYTAAQFADLAYREEKDVKRKRPDLDVELFWDRRTDTEVYGIFNPTTNTIIIAARGTENKEGAESMILDWRTNFKCELTPAKVKRPDGGTELLGWVHKGFWESVSSVFHGLQRFVDSFIRRQSAIGQMPNLDFTGHSLGGGLATLLAAAFTAKGYFVRSVNTIAAPLVGGAQFVDWYQRSGLHDRTLHMRMSEHDPVPYMSALLDKKLGLDYPFYETAGRVCEFQKDPASGILMPVFYRQRGSAPRKSDVSLFDATWHARSHYILTIGRTVGIANPGKLPNAHAFGAGGASSPGLSCYTTRAVGGFTIFAVNRNVTRTIYPQNNLTPMARPFNL